MFTLHSMVNKYTSDALGILSGKALAQNRQNLSIT